MSRNRAEAVGRQVLANLAAGRKALQAVNEERKERGDFYRRIIAEYVLLELRAGQSSWGRAGRIARKLHGRLSERQIRKYLVLLASGSESVTYDGLIQKRRAIHGSY